MIPVIPTIRSRGYYWVKFPYEIWGSAFTDVPEHWEVGSWDPDYQRWCLIGSKDTWYDWQMKEVGEKVEYTNTGKEIK